MSCEKCEMAQHNGEQYFFRWKNANIALMGCREHIQEVMQKLGDKTVGEDEEN